MKLRVFCGIACAALLAAIPCFATPPASIKASYNLLRNGLHIATVQESFAKDGDKYAIVSATDPAGPLKLLFRTQVRIHSSGAVTPSGLRPELFDYGRLDDVSKNVNAEFDWNAEQLRMAFEGRTQTVPLLRGTQDRLSLMYQFMFLPLDKLKLVAFPMTNGRKIETYRYQVAGSEPIDTPLGRMNALHLVKQREPGDNAVEVWLAPERSFMPVRLVIVESDGSRFEQVITRLELK